MKFKIISIAIIVAVVCITCTKTELKAETAQIIPQPNNISVDEGVFLLDDNVAIEADDVFSVSSTFLKSFIENGSSIVLKSGPTENKIIFVKDETIAQSEGYKLQVLPNKIEIRAKTDQGAFYAVQSLRQLLPISFENGSYTTKNAAIACLSIEDSPRFTYRGMHLDVGRHFYPVDFIKKYIDALAMLKMNTFHWHLTEDQGWRIEIKSYPKLQEIAAYRKETLVGHYGNQSHKFDGKRYGGYYTQEEVKEIVKYAQDRFITVIPEIEMPGHSQAAIAAYPELGCTGEQIEVATVWGVTDGVYCTKEINFEFLENVLDEVLELFPSEYIHIGGDEAPKKNWKKCKDCQKRIKEEGLKDEHELQNYFITRIEKYLNNKGRQIIGWDEILEGGLAPNATVMSWRGINGAIEAAKQHHNVVMTPNSHCYFDHYQSESANEPLAIGGYLPLEKVYSYDPIPEELTTEEAKYVLGAQGNVWTEYMPSSSQVEYMIFPRIFAMSEVGWTNLNNKNYNAFVPRVKHFFNRLEKLDYNYANHLYEIEGHLNSENRPIFHLKVKASNEDIRYTLDGTEPSAESELYTKPISINESVVIKAAVFNNNEKLGETFVQKIELHKAVGKHINLSVEPNRHYKGSGAQGLINGISGDNKRYNDEEWLGFSGDDVEIKIDLGQEEQINSIKTRFYNSQGSWIYIPKELSIVFDSDSLNYELPYKEGELYPVEYKVDAKSRFVTLKVKNFGNIPKGNAGEGNRSWLFLDEVIIN